VIRALADEHDWSRSKIAKVLTKVIYDDGNKPGNKGQTEVRYQHVKNVLDAPRPKTPAAG
jgi:hypothetical protein